MVKDFVEKIREIFSVKLTESAQKEKGDPLNRKYFKFLRNRILIWGAILIISYIVIFALWMSRSIPSESLSKILLILFGACIIAIIAHIYALALSYVYEDAKRRGMMPGLWFLICLFVPYLIGFVLYLLVRAPLPLTCPKCYQPAPSFSKYCPNCGFQLRFSCPKCNAPIPEGAKFCPQCGNPL